MRNHSRSVERNYEISFFFIKFMHDNALLKALIDPVQLLRELGLHEGHHVMEVGCGPGFFTLGAARVVGEHGRVYAYDVNPHATDYVKSKLVKQSIRNVQVETRNAAETGLPGSCIDFVFVTGVPHVAGGKQTLLEEIVRVLNPGGILAYKPSRGNPASLIDAAIKLGLERREDRKRFLIFRK